jgi:hypothetical protein
VNRREFIKNGLAFFAGCLVAPFVKADPRNARAKAQSLLATDRATLEGEWRVVSRATPEGMVAEEWIGNTLIQRTVKPKPVKLATRTRFTKKQMEEIFARGEL